MRPAGDVATAAGEAYFPSLAASSQEAGTMTASFDFVAACKPGMVLRTRDRSEATIARVAGEEGLIHGEVRMFGACVWRRDGRFRGAPAGAAGPLDLMPPEAAAEATPRKTILLKDALDPANRSFCCD
jgi:hypothetical protein